MPRSSQSIQKLALGGRLYNYGFNDTLLFTEAYTRPRYEGSKLIGAKINEYTDYTQSTPEEFLRRITNLVRDYPGNRPVGFINTTKPIEVTFPVGLFKIYDTSPGLKAAAFVPYFKGRPLFPVLTSELKPDYPGLPGQTFDGLNFPLNSLGDLFKQNGEIKVKSEAYIYKKQQRVYFAFLVQESQYSGGYRRDRSYGKNPVIEVKTNTIYEYDWGESAYPFLENGGTGHLKQILSIDDYSSENISFKASNEGDTLYDEYDQLLKRTLNKGDQIEVEQYIKGSNISSEFPIKQEVALRPSIGTPSKESLTVKLNSMLQQDF